MHVNMKYAHKDLRVCVSVCVWIYIYVRVCACIYVCVCVGKGEKNNQRPAIGVHYKLN